MDVHPWTKYEVTQLRHEERVLRGLAAYHALRGQDESSPEVGLRPAGRMRVLDRLLRRHARVGTGHVSARSTT